jgi:hypothetical protein
MKKSVKKSVILLLEVDTESTPISVGYFSTSDNRHLKLNDLMREVFTSPEPLQTELNRESNQINN